MCAAFLHVVACSSESSSEGEDLNEQDGISQADVEPTDGLVDPDLSETSSTPDVIDQDQPEGDQTDSPDTTGPDTEETVEQPAIPFTCSNKAIQQGWNEKWQVAGKERSLFADLPNPTGRKPIAVIIALHGFGDTVNNFRKFFSPVPDGDPDFPVAVLYPVSMALLPFGGDPGIEWAIFDSAPGDNNWDAKLFEEMLGCLATTYSIDPGRIYAFGFSAGAIFTNMLHARYPDLLRAVVSMSGAWFNESQTVAGVNTMGMATLNWSPMEPAAGTVLMTHGGVSDTYGGAGLTIIDFEKSAQYALPFLQDHGRTVVDCKHNSGHTNHPYLPPGSIVQFFKDHASKTESPYLDAGLPNWFHSSCSLLIPSL
jgi:predicted esterase